MSGVVVIEFAASGLTTKVDVSRLTKGLYLIRSSSNDSYIKIEKLIIN